MEDNRSTHEKVNDQKYIPDRPSADNSKLIPNRIKDLYITCRASEFNAAVLAQCKQLPPRKFRVPNIDGVETSIIYRQHCYTSAGVHKLKNETSYSYEIFVDTVMTTYSQYRAIGHEIGHILLWELAAKNKPLPLEKSDDIEVFCDHFGHEFITQL